MLTRLKFKNWRTLRDVTIDNLTPITVFIGANSSGKTNIIDALNFMRYVIEYGVLEAIFAWQGIEKIHTIGIPLEDAIELEYTFFSQPTSALSYKLKFYATGDLSHYWYREQILKGEIGVLERTGNGNSTLNDNGEEVFTGLAGYYSSDKKLRSKRPEIQQVIEEISTYSTQRWQLLREQFSSTTSVIAGDPGKLFVVDPLGRNVPTIMHFMRQVDPRRFKRFVDDIKVLLPHIDNLMTEADQRETRFAIRELGLGTQDAPSISAGSARLITMLLAYHLADWRLPKVPALIAIEEPDTALNPLLLRKFVDLLREYADRPVARQFILTTHNPELLNYFQPEEVRVVERDPETGYTTVNRVPEYLKETWLPRHPLGEAWTSRVLGGVPEE